MSLARCSTSLLPRCIGSRPGDGAQLVDFEDYAHGRQPRERGLGPAVAVIEAEGDIVDGKDQGGNPFSRGSSIYADDQHGVVVMRETATRPDGATLDIDEVHIIAFDSEGRISDLWDLPSDPEAHNRFFDGE